MAKKISIIEELVSREKLIKKEYKPDSLRIIKQVRLSNSEEEDLFYQAAIELLDLIYQFNKATKSIQGG